MKDQRMQSLVSSTFGPRNQTKGTLHPVTLHAPAQAFVHVIRRVLVMDQSSIVNGASANLQETN